jgi:hypothetical protein
MTVTIAGISFDHHHYDERGDVLYLNVGETRLATRGLETPDGHSIHYDESGPSSASDAPDAIGERAELSRQTSDHQAGLNFRAPQLLMCG